MTKPTPPKERFNLDLYPEERRVMRELRTVLERRSSATVSLSDVIRVALREMAEREGVPVVVAS